MPWLAVLILLQALALGCDDGGESGARGRPCASDGECGNLVCAAAAVDAPEDLADRVLACAPPIDDAAPPGSDCDTTADCDHGLCLLAGACALPCADDADCAELERCRLVYSRASSETLQPVTACVPLVSLSPESRVGIEELSMALTDGGASVDLPAPFEGADTFYVLEHLDESWPDTVVCRPPTCVRRVTPIDAPSEVLFDADRDYRTEPPPRLPVTTGNQIHVPVLRVDAALADPSGYRVQLDAEMAGDLRVTRVARAADTDTTVPRRLDLNVFYLDGLGWAPEGDRGPEPLALALEEVDRILEPANLFVGEVRQLTVPGALPMRGTTYDEPGHGFRMVKVRFGVWAELPYLFRLSDGAAGSAVNLFLVASMEGDAVAHSGGIPGPPGIHGTGSSGIVAVVDEVQVTDPVRLGRTLAHELGHYLGLFHLSERDGSVVENLTDTPACGLDLDTDASGSLDLEECAGAGDSNLMFWGPGVDTLLTPEQRGVLQGNPLLQ